MTRLPYTGKPENKKPHHLFTKKIYVMKLFKVMLRVETYQTKYVMAENGEQAEQKAEAHGWDEKEQVESTEVYCQDLSNDPEYKNFKSQFIVK